MDTTTGTDRQEAVKPHRRGPRRTRAQTVRHTRLFRWIDPRITRHPRIYLVQATMAAVIFGALLLAYDILTHGVVVVAVAASVAIVFFVPHSVASAPLRIVSGHTVGIIAAYTVLGLAILFPESIADTKWFIDISAALALGLVVLLMTITNTQHAPAAGTAVGLTVTGVHLSTVLFILTAAVLIALVRIALGDRLHNLI